MVDSLLLRLLLTLLPPIGLGWFAARRPWWAAFAAGVLAIWGAPLWLWIAAASLAGILLFPPVRAVLVGAPLLRLVRALRLLPQISDTERQALEAGSTWIDAELFSGQPDCKRILAEPYPELGPEERAFLDGPCEKVCDMTRDWEVHERRDLPSEVWQYLKDEGFFGLIIPKEFGGKGFSASANSAVVQKLSSTSMALGVTVMVPNSLGPAELLVHYGTPEQKSHYLPRLARGEDVPCFALTEPLAGSDAGSIRAEGLVFRAADRRLMLRLNWNKRYITLASVSTVLGLAFKLRDPDDLLGQGKEPGITCALIPTATPGVDVGWRHDPMGVPFHNCATKGVDVVVPIDCIIGGPQGAGRGWQMLMECLAAGRGISLPACSTAGAKTAARVAGAYAAIRKQFGLSVGKFEGVEEPLARIGGIAWLLEAMRRFTCGALDRGQKPAIVTAMAKYNSTELCREAVNEAMDVLGGAGVSRGPRNALASAYEGLPICITVEGHNILTRTLMVFGQGAIRCHPYVWKEVQALEARDARAFDAALFGHLGHVWRNACRALLLGLTRGALGRPPVQGRAARWWRKIEWSSARFALWADLALLSIGGDLKRKEKLSGRFADVLSWMFLGTAALRRWQAEGEREEEAPFLDWTLAHACARIQQGFAGILANWPTRGLGWLCRGPLSLLNRLNPIGIEPSDRVGAAVARAIQVPGALRDRLTAGIHRPQDPTAPLARLEHPLTLCAQAEEIVQRMKAAQRDRRLAKGKPERLLAEAVSAGVITYPEAELVRQAEAAREEAVQVDAFTLEEYARGAASLGARQNGAAASYQG